MVTRSQAHAQTLAGNYQIIDLGTGVGAWSNARRINNRNQILGVQGTLIPTSPFELVSEARQVLEQSDQTHNLSGLNIAVAAINDSGLILTNDQNRSAVYGLLDGSIRELTEVGGVATDIDNAGIIVSRGSGIPWLVDGDQVTELDIPDGFGAVLPSAIWGYRQVVGAARETLPGVGGANQRGVYYGRGSFVALPPAPGRTTSHAADVNNAGLVVGGGGVFGMHDTVASGHAFVFNPVEESLLDIGSLPGHATRSAHAINSGGQVVGLAWSPHDDSPPCSRAFLYPPGESGALDLNTLLPVGSGWILRKASNINDAGLIVGKGEINGETHGFLLVRN